MAKGNKTWSFGKIETAEKHAKAGEFEAVWDLKPGLNQVRYQTPSGEWCTGIVKIGK